jgi:AcrR family transcriptional regulator
MALEVVDGRTIRREKSRQRIIDAIIELVTDGKLEPTAEDVAVLANVTTRTVFRHFKDMEGLYREIVADMHAETDALRVPFEPDRDWREQFDELVARRTNLFECYTNRLLLSESLRSRSPAIADEMDVLVSQLREGLKARLPEAIVVDSIALASLEVALGWEVWIRLRRDQGLSVNRARSVVQKLTDSVLTGYAL